MNPSVWKLLNLPPLCTPTFNSPGFIVVWSAFYRGDVSGLVDLMRNSLFTRFMYVYLFLYRSLALSVFQRWSGRLS